VQGKIIFANQLRGLAALAVVVTHFGFTYWRHNKDLSPAFGATPIETDQLITASLFTNIFPGVFGVALFFLISGFVIPFSIAHLNRAQFALSRAFRIYPTYWICIFYTTAAAYLSAHYWGNSLNYTTSLIIKNLLLVHTLDDSASIDLVNWTLAIEIKFYLLFAILHKLVTSGSSARVLTITAALFAAANVAGGRLGAELVLISFMLIGTLFHMHLTGRIGKTELIASSTAIMCAVFYFWNLTPWPNSRQPLALHYLAAVLIFSGCYFARQNFKPSRVLDFFADISYPLYLVHSVAGFGVISVMLNEGFGKLAAISTATATALFAAYLIHKAIELPSNEYGKSLLRRWSSAKKLPLMQ
jgi:peptidoglycan/LPS O-acetylase OafA/YrhL